MSAASEASRVRVGGLELDPLDEAAVVARVTADAAAGRGGWIVTPNVDICRAVARNPALSALVAQATLVVPDGMPLLWAAQVAGTPLPQRVTGASLIFSLSAAAARDGRSVYLLGGADGVPEAAAAELVRRYPGLKVAGTDAPPVGFDVTPAGIEAVAARLAAAGPDLVFVGLGFPKQEHLIAKLAPALPAAWFLGCGAAIAFAAGDVPRAPAWMQSAGLEWTFRLLAEPKRLFRRYLVDDLPFAARLLSTTAVGRVRAGRSRP